MYVVGTGPTGAVMSKTNGLRNATRAQNMPPRGGARLPIEAHAVTFPMVHLALVLLGVGRLHDEALANYQVNTSRCPGFLRSRPQVDQGGLKSEILVNPDPDPDSG